MPGMEDNQLVQMLVQSCRLRKAYAAHSKPHETEIFTNSDKLATVRSTRLCTPLARQTTETRYHENLSTTLVRRQRTGKGG